MELKFLFYNILLAASLFLALLFSSSSASSTSSNLSFNFYATSCPAAEFMIRNTVRSASESDPTIPGKLLRLLFHDCMVEGCDGSVLLAGNGTERSDPANGSLGGFSVVESAKRVLEIFCPETVSCADILALAARDAVGFAGGPMIQVETGRRDGKVSSASNVRSNMVDTNFSLDEMIQHFSSKGLSVDDLVVLSGAHTIGLAHCSSIRDRFQKDSKGKMTLIDKSLDQIYAAKLMQQCPADASASVTIQNDPETSFMFDNQYYKNLLLRQGLFQSDSVLFSDERTKKKVVEFSSSQDSFFQSWETSFVKLASMGVKTGDEGEIRRSCQSING
ncbi:Peroxidase [Thalictrum thalictroides]|uniref:Peroxidase n=1 Tax=Thalictrum thalictroides TaxID=46969 RepID=A0A7J6VCT5_THATH|nr:Peroxidase [Thalictrum thalictroides]